MRYVLGFKISEFQKTLTKVFNFGDQENSVIGNNYIVDASVWTETLDLWKADTNKNI